MSAELRAYDVELLNAVHRGNRRVWDALTTTDFVYVEDGEVSRRAEFLQGLAEDGSRPLEILTYDMQLIGDVAIVTHLDGLSARDRVDPSRSRFLFLETWQRVDGHWKLRVIHIDRLRIDPAPVSLTMKQMIAFTGDYVSGEARYTVSVRSGRLIGRRSGRSEEELQAETADVLFVPGNFFLRKIFRFNNKGVVTAFIDRNVAADRVWSRTTTAASE